MTILAFSDVLLFGVAWVLFGVACWIQVFLEFRKIRYLRPGLIELILFMIVGPVPFFISVFKDK